MDCLLKKGVKNLPFSNGNELKINHPLNLRIIVNLAMLTFNRITEIFTLNPISKNATINVIVFFNQRSGGIFLSQFFSNIFSANGSKKYEKSKTRFFNS